MQKLPNNPRNPNSTARNPAIHPLFSSRPTQVLVLPTLFTRLRRRLGRWLRVRFLFEPVMEMHALPRDEIIALLEQSGAEMLNIYRYDAAGSELESWGYLARKR